MHEVDSVGFELGDQWEVHSTGYDNVAISLHKKVIVHGTNSFRLFCPWMNEKHSFIHHAKVDDLHWRPQH